MVIVDLQGRIIRSSLIPLSGNIDLKGLAAGRYQLIASDDVGTRIHLSLIVQVH
jgi:hypothetical protein